MLHFARLQSHAYSQSYALMTPNLSKLNLRFWIAISKHSRRQDFTASPNFQCATEKESPSLRSVQFLKIFGWQSRRGSRISLFSLFRRKVKNLPSILMWNKSRMTKKRWKYNIITTGYRQHQQWLARLPVTVDFTLSSAHQVTHCLRRNNKVATIITI